MKLGFVSLKYKLHSTDITVGFPFSVYNTTGLIILRLKPNTAMKFKVLISRSCLNLVQQIVKPSNPHHQIKLKGIQVIRSKNYSRSEFHSQ